MSKKLAQHNILCYKGRYFCHFCKCVVPNLQNILSYINSKKHVALKYNEMFNQFIEKYAKGAYKEFVDNNVEITANYNFICVSCERNFEDVFGALQHVQKNKHHIKKFKDDILDHMKEKHSEVIIKTQQKEDINNDEEKNVNNNTEILQEKKHIKSNNTNEEMRLFIDNILLEKQDNNKNTIDNINRKINNEKNKLDLIEIESTKKLQLQFQTMKIKKKHVNVKSCNCKICNLLTSKKCLQLIQQELLDNKVIIYAYTNFFCILCMCNLKILCNILTHIKGKAHKNMLKHHLRFNTFEHSMSADKLIVDSSNSIINTNTNLEHSSNNADCIPNHNASISVNGTENNEILDANEELNSYHNLIPHCQGEMHSSKIKKWFFIESYSGTTDMDTLTNRVNELFISNENENNVKHDEDLTITDDVTEQITKFLNTSEDEKFDLKTRRLKIEKSNHSETKEKSSAACSNQEYNKNCLEVEEKMYIVQHKLESIKINLRFVILLNKYNFCCLACNERISRDTYLLYEHICIESHKMKVRSMKKSTNFEIVKNPYLQKRKYKEKCFLCRQWITNSTINITKHINSLSHISTCEITKVSNSISEDLSNLWYNIQRFGCVLCLQTFNQKMLFIKHVVSEHSQILFKHNYVINFCIPCTTLWLDNKDSYTEHCNHITHKYLIRSKDFMVEKLPESIKHILKLVDDHSNSLFEQSQAILLNDNKQQEIKQSLESILKQIFPSIQVFVFGSRVTGLGLETSDIDIYLDCGNTYDQDICENNFNIIKRTLYLHEKEWGITDTVENCRTPLIRLIHRQTGTQCDITIKNGLCVENSKLIRSFNDAYPPCRKLILFVRKWFSLFNLTEGHGLKNYALAWLVIFYLQSCSPESYLPSVATLIKQNKKSKLICGWETGVAKPEKINKSEESVSTLLMGFLKFYASFDYQHYVICPLMGERISKRAFADLILPMEMNPYIEHLHTSESREYFRIDSPLCVQDPFDLSHNLTKAVTSITLKYFKQYCQDSLSCFI
ncbi:uncharacterized protein LOC143424454 [Xylocopa sonorina]|uniref:uncharacterized protein LOC143424454 n=1 Tax=Xylocopa sonorina TaxID=1818115 RepID=UPI00403AAE7C